MRIRSIWDLFELNMEGWFPLTPLWIIARNLPGGTLSILDLGCGGGFPVKFLNRKKRFYVVGVDIQGLPGEQQCEAFSEVIWADVRSLPFRREAFDVVLGIRVVEHLRKEQGEKLITDMERIAKKAVILSLPVGEFKSTGEAEPDVHKSSWRPSELRALGYKVIGNGLFGITTGPQLALRFPFLFPLFRFIWICAGIISYRFPEIGGNMVAIKNFTGKGIYRTTHRAEC